MASTTGWAVRAGLGLTDRRSQPCKVQSKDVSSRGNSVYKVPEEGKSLEWSWAGRRKVRALTGAE